jgi:N-methylhydantoinase B
MSKLSALEQIHMQIMWNRLISVVEEQAQTLIRTAFSTSTREAGDLSAGVFDMNGDMLAQAVTGTPGHINAMAASVKFFIEDFPVDSMEEGNVYITNNPWKGTGHRHDFTVVTPTFMDGRMVAMFAATSHVVDIGGLGFGPDGRQVYEEGLGIPMMMLAKKGVMNEDLLGIVRENVRVPVEVEGDLYSLAACNEIGSRRLVDMMREFKLETLDTLAKYIIDTSYDAMMEEIHKLPKGVYKNHMQSDGYDRLVDLFATMTIDDDGMTIDFDGTSPVSTYGINVPLTYTQAYTTFGLRCIIGREVPNNAGSLSSVKVTAPEGCILNAQPPCAVAVRHVIGQMLPDVVFGCLYQAMNENKVMTEGSASLWNPVLLGNHGLVGDYDYGDATPFTVGLFHTGGTGARPDKDGLSATSFPSGVRNTPVEINETIGPIIIWRKEYRADSGGAGKYRGGAGQILEITHAENAPFAINAMCDRCKSPARGRAGGQSGWLGHVRLKSGVELRNYGRQPIPPGDALILETPGGGGFGDPFKRDPAAVVHDVTNGMVTREAALEDYGVVITDDGALDQAATTSARAKA